MLKSENKKLIVQFVRTYISTIFGLEVRNERRISLAANTLTLTTVTRTQR